MNTSNAIVGLCVAALLAGCGGSSTSNSGRVVVPLEGPGVTPVDNFADANVELLRLGGLIQDPTTRTLTSELPASATYRYDGLMSVVLQDGSADGVIGNMALVVDFGKDRISGSAGNFVSFSNEKREGSLIADGGVLSSETLATGLLRFDGDITFAAGKMDVELESTVGFDEADAAQIVVGTTAINGRSKLAGGEIIQTTMSGIAER